MTHLLIHLVIVACVAVCFDPATCIISFVVSQQVPDAEFEALRALYDSTGGDSWNWLPESTAGPRWNFTEDNSGNTDNPCSSGSGGAAVANQSWQGVTCSSTPNWCLTHICHVTGLTLALYNARGHIPPQICNLTSLQHLILENNELQGPLPSNIGQLTNLTILSLWGNDLTGTIHSTVKKLTGLTYFNLDSNQLTGRIPSEVGHLTALNELWFSDNELTGAVPTEIGYLTSLENLYLNLNLLTGTLPTELGKLTALRRLSLRNNFLSGTIPRELGNLQLLEVLSLYINQLTGSLPVELVTYTALQELWLYSNVLTGSLPSDIGALTALEQLWLYNNELTGSLPSGVGKLTALKIMSLYNNRFTGAFPDTIGQMTNLEDIWLRDNEMTGTIPSTLCQLTALKEIMVQRNRLTGPIPVGIGVLVYLEQLILEGNHLSGEVPSDMAKLSRLRNLLLNDNRLTGDTKEVFNHSSQLSLTTIDMSNNKLTSVFTSEIFLLPQIKVLALSVNCFKEQIPSSLCRAKQLEVLSLNGLDAAEACHESITFPFSGVRLFSTVGGSIPECIWNLPNLTVLHLAGNGLTGKIMPPSHSLVDLSLPHNQLSGTIPANTLHVPQLDLSYNRFSGEYLSTTQQAFDASINVEINRLSGHLPVLELKRVVNGSLNILQGNMFSCNSIPRNDDSEDEYVCGSKNLNISILCCVAVATVLLVALLVVVLVNHSSKFQIITVSTKIDLIREYMTYMKSLDGVDKAPLCTIAMMSATFERIIKFAIALLVVVVVSIFPLYLFKALDTRNTYTTHTHTYTWFWTLAYMRGVLPAGLLVTSWMVVIGACYYVVVLSPTTYIDKNSTLLESKTSASGDSSVPPTLKSHYAVRGIAFVVNAAIIIPVNAAYIYSTQQALSAASHLSIQLALSVFRLIYMKAALPLLAKSLTRPIDNVRFRFLLLSINNLIIPCLVTMLTSKSCFQGLLIPADEVSTPYTYGSCITYYTELDGEPYCSYFDPALEAVSAPVTPPFDYNNQCGSVILTSYLPVLLLGASVQVLLTTIVPLILQQVSYESVDHRFRILFSGVLVIWPEYWGRNSAKVTSTDMDRQSKDPFILAEARTILCNDILNNWLLVLTFGMCSPIVAVVVTGVVVVKMFITVTLIGRFTRTVMSTTYTSSRDDSTNRTVYDPLRILGMCYIPLYGVLTEAFWRLLYCSTVFIVVVSWDIASDEVGRMRSLWVAVVPLSYVILLRCGAMGLCSFRIKNDINSPRLQWLGKEAPGVVEHALGGSGDMGEDGDGDDFGNRDVSTRLSHHRNPLHVEA